jgi:hypothetical protein
MAAYHGDNPLFLVGVQDFGGTGPLFFIESAIQADHLIAMAESSNCLRSERYHLGDLRGTGVLGQLQKGQGAQYHANLLHPTLQQCSQFLLILFGNIDIQRWTAHTPSMRQNNST